MQSSTVATEPTFFFCTPSAMESVRAWRCDCRVILIRPLEEQLISVYSITRSRYCISGSILKRQADSSPRLFSRQCGKNLLTFPQEKAWPSSYTRATEWNCNCPRRSWEAQRLKKQDKMRENSEDGKQNCWVRADPDACGPGF